LCNSGRAAETLCKGVVNARWSDMARLPRRFAPLVYGVIQVAITTAVATAVAVYQSTGFVAAALVHWAVAWLAALLLMLPIVIFISPLVQRLVAAITSEAPR
jgi:Protein of unknown function (DUF2798)